MTSWCPGSTATEQCLKGSGGHQTVPKATPPQPLVKHSHSEKEKQGTEKNQSKVSLKPSRANIKSCSSVSAIQRTSCENVVPEGIGTTTLMTLPVATHTFSLLGWLQLCSATFLGRYCTFLASVIPEVSKCLWFYSHSFTHFFLRGSLPSLPGFLMKSQWKPP